MNSQTSTEKTFDIRILNGFMSGLQRLFKIGVYYPEGHEILDTATRTFLDILQAVTEDKHTVTIHHAGDAIFIAGYELSSRHPFAREFKALLTGLGIERITLDRQIAPAEIHSFIRQLLAGRASVANTKKFIAWDMASLPQSVRIHQREYIAEGETGSVPHSSREAKENLEGLYTSLAGHGFSATEIMQCRRLIEGLPAKTANLAAEAAHLPSASWDDVARLLASIVRKRRGPLHPPGEPADRNSSINALGSLFRQLGGEEAGQRAQQLINLLVSAVELPTADSVLPPQEDSPPPPRHTLPGEPLFSVYELQEFVTKNSLKPKIVEQLPLAPTSTETLSILLQLARYPLSASSQLRMELMLRNILGGEIGDKHWLILRHGLSELVNDRNGTTLAIILPMVVAPLRQRQPGLPYRLFLLILQQGGRDAMALLWPYIVNELLLVGNSNNSNDYPQLCALAAAMPIDAMSSQRSRLNTLDAFSNRTVAPHLTRGITRKCYLLFAFLLGTELKRQIADRLISGFQDQPPPDPLLVGIAPLLDPDNQDHHLFLRAYLAQTAKGQLSAAVQHAAGELIISRLGALGRDRRSEPWVQGAVAALAMTAGDEVTLFLRQVQSEKNILLIPDWPPGVRDAAESVLRRLKKSRPGRSPHA